MFAWSAAVPAPGQLAYYVTGGITSYPALDNDAVVINNVYRYVSGDNRWEASPAMSTPRYAHTAAWVFAGNRGMCVAGGLNVGEDAEGDAVTVLLTGGECFNPSTGVWQPTGDMNFPRYNAGSAIGPDGNWYIFGGLDANGGVPETEVYDAQSNTWRVLGGEFVLGGSAQNPARVWPRGAFWGNNLYVFGGNTPPNENRVVSSAERMTLGVDAMPLANRIMFPLATMSGAENFLVGSTPLHLNVPVAGNFVESTQFFNGYFFDWPTFGKAIVHLVNVSDQSNLVLSVLDIHKTRLVKESVPITGNVTVSRTLLPGRYFVVVERAFPRDMPDPNQVYQLILQRP